MTQLDITLIIVARTGGIAVRALLEYVVVRYGDQSNLDSR